jgi:IS5 family transposase
LVERLQPFYPKGVRGRPSIGLERMLKIYFLQQWYALAGEALEDAPCDSQALCGFAGIELNRDPVSDATTYPALPLLAGEARPDSGAV